MLSFELPITPPTATAQQKKHYYNKNLGRVATYKPKNVISAENLLMTALYPHKPASPLGGALSVRIVFYFPFKKTEKKSIIKAGLPVPKTTKPDLDNMAKNVLDAMTKLGFWTDDALIFDLTLTKYYATQGKIKIEIMQFNQKNERTI